jgi:hypothetical protein
MKNQEQIIKRAGEIIRQTEPSKLDDLLWDMGFQMSQGFWKPAKHIEDGQFTQEAIDFAEENFIINENIDAYVQMVDHAVSLSKDHEDFAGMDEEEIYEEVESNYNCLTWGAFENFCYHCTQLAMEEFA